MDGATPASRARLEGQQRQPLAPGGLTLAESNLMKADKPRSVFGDNPLRTRADFQQAARDLFAPLVPYYEQGGARVVLGPTAAIYDEAAASLEAFIRPIWALAPLAAGGGSFEHWELIRAGLAAGTDPDSTQYWGPLGTIPDQRMVEMAAFGLALAMAPEEFFDPLTDCEKQNVVVWLAQINTVVLHENNWQFFRVLVNVGLERVGGPVDWEAAAESIATIESNYLGDGWYRDGESVQTTDFYIPFAFHFYSLIYAAIRGDKDPPRAAAFRKRAAQFAPDWAARFDSRGRVIAYGRSMTYRCAGAGFFGALALADVEGIPWSEMRGLWAKHLRWWAEQDIVDDRGVLSIGWAYPNLLMSESYNAPGSPYWALKAFLPLALPDEHPFWATPEAADAGSRAVHEPQPHAHMVVNRNAGQAQVLSAGGPGLWFPRQGPAKYGKLAYSSAFPFALEPDDPRRAMSAESNLAFIDATTGIREVRSRTVDSGVDGDVAWSHWEVFGGDAAVSTILVGRGDEHCRVHVVDLTRTFTTCEGGFAIEYCFDPTTADDRCTTSRSTAAIAYALAGNHASTSVIMDPTGGRKAEVTVLQPNTSLQWPRSTAPVLTAELDAGRHVLVCGVRAVETTDDLEVDVASLLTEPAWAVLERVCGSTVQRPTMAGL